METQIKFPRVVQKSYLQAINIHVGKLTMKVSLVGLSTYGNGTLCCFYGKCQPVLRAQCKAQVYYVLPKDNRCTCLMIHHEHHDHEVQRGTSRTAKEIVCNVVWESLSQMENVCPHKIQMELVKKLTLVSLQCNHVTPTHHIGPEELFILLQKMYLLIQGER